MATNAKSDNIRQRKKNMFSKRKIIQLLSNLHKLSVVKIRMFQGVNGLAIKNKRKKE